MLYFHIFLSSHPPEGVKMRKGGKVTTFVSIIPLIFSLSSNHPQGERMRKGGKEPLYLSEEFVEKFSEVFFRDDWIIN